MCPFGVYGHNATGMVWFLTRSPTRRDTTMSGIDTWVFGCLDIIINDLCLSGFSVAVSILPQFFPVPVQDWARWANCRNCVTDVRGRQTKGNYSTISPPQWEATSVLHPSQRATTLKYQYDKWKLLYRLLSQVAAYKGRSSPLCQTQDQRPKTFDTQ